MSTQLPVRNLDVLRAVAVACVVGDHVRALFSEHVGSVITVWELGRVGVLMFFVHTALVLMSSLERQKSGAHWAGAFYVRRAFRIYPLAIAAIFVYLAFRIPASVLSIAHPAPFKPISMAALLENLALVQNLFGTRLPIDVLWSLPLEVQMYVALPVCFLLARRGPWFVVGALVLGAAAWQTGSVIQLPGFWRMTVLNYTPCFLLGVLAYSLARNPTLHGRLPALCWPVVVFGTLPFAGRLHPTAYNPPINWLVCLPLGLAIPLVRDLRESVVTRIAKVVCDYSYAIYLTHIAALWLAFVVCRSLPLTLQLGIFAAGVSALAFVSRHVVELPGMAAGKRMAAWLAARPLAPASAMSDSAR
jgi:peptidoglycan/LPS O-acetylase OafA/YrhL